MTDMANAARPAPGPSATATALRRIILALFFLSALVLLAELMLLEHTESATQLLPFAGIGAAMLAMAWVRLRPGRASLRVAQGVMVALAVVGLVGLWLHYQANVAFELEMHPSLEGWDLFREAMQGAMPALAPGLLGQLGLLGLAYTVRHPARSSDTRTEERT